MNGGRPKWTSLHFFVYLSSCGRRLIGTVTSNKDGLASKDNTVFNKGMVSPRSLNTGFAYSNDGTPLGYNSAILSFKADGGFGAAQLAFTNTNELYYRIAWGGNEEWKRIGTV